MYFVVVVFCRKQKKGHCLISVFFPRNQQESPVPYMCFLFFPRNQQESPVPYMCFLFFPRNQQESPIPCVFSFQEIIKKAQYLICVLISFQEMEHYGQWSGGKNKVRINMASKGTLFLQLFVLWETPMNLNLFIIPCKVVLSCLGFSVGWWL